MTAFQITSYLNDEWEWYKVRDHIQKCWDIEPNQSKRVNDLLQTAEMISRNASGNIRRYFYNIWAPHILHFIDPSNQLRANHKFKEMLNLAHDYLYPPYDWKFTKMRGIRFLENANLRIIGQSYERVPLAFKIAHELLEEEHEEEIVRSFYIFFQNKVLPEAPIKHWDQVDKRMRRLLRIEDLCGDSYEPSYESVSEPPRPMKDVTPQKPRLAYRR